MSGGRVRATARQVRDVLGVAVRSPDLGRVQLAFAGFNSAEWGTWLAMLVYAYRQGGTTTAGVVAAVQLVPAALFAPIGSALGDRYRPGRVLGGGYAAQAAAMGLTAAALLSHASPYVAYALAAVSSTAVTVTRPTMSAFTPTLARTPEELVAVNVLSSWVESVSVLVAPALTGIVLGVSGPGAVFAVMAVVVAGSALLVLPMPGPPPAGDVELRANFVSSLREGAEVLRQERAVRLLVLVLCAGFVVVGALDVLYPTLAIGVLGQGASWAGYLNAAFGAGGALGVGLTAGLVGRARLLPPMLAGVALYVSAFVLLAAAGAGRVLLDVAARTLLQRAAPSDTLARVFGLLEGLGMAGLAIGSLGVSALVSLGGARLGIIGIGCLLPLALAIAGRALLDIDREADVPVVAIGLLRGQHVFSPLAPATMETLARRLAQLDVPPGEELITQGARGDRCYLVADGGVEVVRDGVVVAQLRRGDIFGEVALLRDEPRNATCTATEPSVLFAMEKDDFLEVVTGHPRVSAEAHRLAAARRDPVVETR